MYAKKSCVSFGTFIFICVFFSILQSLQYVGNDVNPSLQGVGLVIQYNIPQPWSPQQHGITRIHHSILNYSECIYVRNVMNIFISLVNPTGFVVI
jgi:hypothetical protein